MGRYREAVKEARKVVKLSPEDPECKRLMEIAQLLYDDISLRKPMLSFKQVKKRGLLRDPEPLNMRLSDRAKEFNCRQCGDCCRNRWDIDIGWRNISRWLDKQLDFILIWVVFHLS